jgi:hypothetical protein
MEKTVNAELLAGAVKEGALGVAASVTPDSSMPGWNVPWAIAMATKSPPARRTLTPLRI